VARLGRMQVESGDGTTSKSGEGVVRGREGADGMALTARRRREWRMEEDEQIRQRE
jgi:hypothetical protein